RDVADFPIQNLSETAICRRRPSLPLWERKDFLGFSLFAKSLENPSEGKFVFFQDPLSCDF
ncbi:hypothetical protein LXJ56_27760, partial [Escherichia coli]|nr:hypothetical protein [Escherichia coli]